MEDLVNSATFQRPIELNISMMNLQWHMLNAYFTQFEKREKRKQGGTLLIFY